MAYERRFGEVPWCPEPWAFLGLARERFERLAVATSATRHDFDLVARRHDLARWFDAIVTGDDTARHKPDPEPYLAALDRLGLPADRALAIEDSPNGVRSADRGGAPGRGAGRRLRRAGAHSRGCRPARGDLRRAGRRARRPRRHLIRSVARVVVRWCPCPPRCPRGTPTLEIARGPARRRPGRRSPSTAASRATWRRRWWTCPAWPRSLAWPACSPRTNRCAWACPRSRRSARPGRCTGSWSGDPTWPGHVRHRHRWQPRAGRGPDGPTPRPPGEGRGPGRRAPGRRRGDRGRGRAGDGHRRHVRRRDRGCRPARRGDRRGAPPGHGLARLRGRAGPDRGGLRDALRRDRRRAGGARSRRPRPRRRAGGRGLARPGRGRPLPESPAPSAHGARDGGAGRCGLRAGQPARPCGRERADRRDRAGGPQLRHGLQPRLAAPARRAGRCGGGHRRAGGGRGTGASGGRRGRGPCGCAALAGVRSVLTGEGAAGRRAALGVGPGSTVVLLVTEGVAANPLGG